MKKTKFAKKIAKLVQAGYEAGADGNHMDQALIEHGLKAMAENDMRYRPLRSVLIRFKDDEMQVIPANTPIRLLVEALDGSDMAAVGSHDRFLVTIDQDCAGFSVQRIAEHQHVDVGDDDLAPRPHKPGLEAWKGEVEAAESAVRPPESPVRADLPFMAPIDAHGASVALLREIHDAPDDDPAKSLAFEGEDRFIAIMLTGLGYLQVDDITDIVTLTTEGRLLAGYRPEGHMDLPVNVAEITGNIDERELAARYIDSKIAGVDHYIAKGDPQHRETFEHVAVVLREIAGEFRQGLHWPTVHIAGRVIAYNEDRGTGHSHASPLFLFFGDVYARNLKAGWWTDINTGQPKKRNVGELFILMVTELAEAYNAYVAREADDKLPEYPGVGVEMGDLLIRIADFCGALQAGNIIEHDPAIRNPGQAMFEEVVQIAARYEAIRKTPEAVGDPETADLLPEMDVAIMVDAKLAFNATRADHKIENRLLEDGKRT